MGESAAGQCRVRLLAGEGGTRRVRGNGGRTTDAWTIRYREAWRGEFWVLRSNRSTVLTVRNTWSSG